MTISEKCCNLSLHQSSERHLKYEVSSVSGDCDLLTHLGILCQFWAQLFFANFLATRKKDVHLKGDQQLNFKVQNVLQPNNLIFNEFDFFPVQTTLTSTAASRGSVSLSSTSITLQGYPVITITLILSRPQRKQNQFFFCVTSIVIQKKIKTIFLYMLSLIFSLTMMSLCFPTQTMFVLEANPLINVICYVKIFVIITLIWWILIHFVSLKRSIQLILLVRYW